MSQPIQLENGSYKKKGYVEGPKWADIGNYMRKLAIACNLEIDVEHEAGILSETVYYTVVGSLANIHSFESTLIKAIDEYNSD